MKLMVGSVVLLAGSIAACMTTPPARTSTEPEPAASSAVSASEPPPVSAVVAAPPNPAPPPRKDASTGDGGVTNGRLPPEVIQRVVRQSFGTLRGCYEDGLRNNRNLHGLIKVKFTIDTSGAVSLIADGGSDLPDRSVFECVVRVFSGIHFPPPEGGVVAVVYPIQFNPGD